MIVLCRHSRIVVRSDVDLPHRRMRIFRADGRGSSVRMDTDLPCGYGLKMEETRRQTSCATMLKDRERHCKDHSNDPCRNRTYLDLKYEQLNTER